ncbi:ankyrin repeat domain-containing protein [Pedobacter frigidisoli]|uniref:ankyrin repeat domain-containing protein n=1 Tax=Pedobacter frigidisoli TaxID=2530455 RepID=UPI00292E7393|nr:ankyrin repeat domain-containing protein [Pedobacter frigidisoli]
MSEQNIAQLINESKFSEAFDLLRSGTKLPENLQEHHKSQIIDQLFRAAQYDIIFHLLQDKTIETDIYELENFDRSVFQSVIRHLKSDEDGTAFFKDFICRFDNINDEVATQTLLGYFLEKLAPLAWIQILADAGCDTNFKNNADENFIHQVVKSNERRFELNETEFNSLRASYVNFLIGQGLDINEGNIVAETPLIAAVKSNKKELIDHLLESGADPNHTDIQGNSAFFYAVAHLQSDQLYDALRAHATPDFNQVNKNGESLLFEYVRMMQGGEAGISFLKKLLNDGADLYQVSRWYNADKTPLDVIAEKSAGVLEAVLETGQIDINRQDDQGNTLLHKVSAFNVNYEPDRAKETYRKVKVLLEYGADAGVTNDQDQTALMLASDDNLKIKTVELLMKQS